ncbi:MAG: efflux RND transporter periplasmic adaptor subunit [Pseudomonadales bacterium]|jgi:RND family efflux transporter MFP subunit|nr:efflux RND transporter periplasmic adaptor subunit [Pseudomonadales bacterium]MDP6473220.1 efflux RND transporter periplasmic adaptor subunit [Pseudomonadales bacterium]MDP6826019.1 efflux RND transporter periplasmic adaptor subunit [Pseudomonadales bacterium]MDP6970751.1 efflux RND transporter periplasmic adaptor subunit [Pseudomonadales bacterium]
MRILLLAVVLVLAGCEGRGAPEPADQAVRPARILIVSTAGETVSHEFVARVEAAQSIDVSFEVSGPLNELPILEGQTVARGELVAALDPTKFELAVREAEVQVQLARQDLERKHRMLRQRSIAQSIVDDAKSIYELQRVRLERARESLADSRITAPFDAYVAQRYVDNFVNVQIGMRIARLNDLHQLLVVANIPEQLLATVTIEEVVSLEAEFPFIPGERFTLTPFENRGEADALAQTYEVSFAMQTPQRFTVLPGMTATVHSTLRKGANEVIVHLPASALVSASDKTFYVWLYDSVSQGVTRRRVEVAAPTENGIPVLSGLEDGEMVVATGASRLQEGMRVRTLGEPVRAFW